LSPVGLLLVVSMPLATPLIIGNWKMHGLRAEGRTLIDALLAAHRQGPGGGTLAVCPPATLLAEAARWLEGSGLLLGGQDCHFEAKGAHTGDISAAMLADAGCTLVIVGHSERRHNHGEGDELVRAKATAALAAGLGVILCVGETEAEREAGSTLEVLDRQIAGSLPPDTSAERLVVAYEPVWAIGTGKSATRDDIAAAHAHLRAGLRQRVAEGAGVRLLYGGSVKAGNAGEILALADVDGVLVGGASLDAEEFMAIYRAGLAAAS
jgi:triosephosphate isomerase (TIM)